MKAKEKAKELVDKYYHLFSVELENTIDYREAKQCALIAVDELINNSMPSSEFGGYVQSYTIEFLQEVKQEIEKL